MQTIVKIKPVPLFDGIANAVSVGDFSIIVGTSASTNITLGSLDADGNFTVTAATRPFNSALTPEQYANWGTDDQYAINTAIANAGLVRDDA